MMKEAVPRPLPVVLPHRSDELLSSYADRRTWLFELVAWWQLERSGLEHRMPSVHGSRLRRYCGKINQIERIIKLLREKPSTRALAVLVDPFRDFTENGQNEEFASFCLVEFKRRDVSGSQHFIDAIAFYRAQEFARWWPINIAELRLLQQEICSALSFPAWPNYNGSGGPILALRRRLQCRSSIDGSIRHRNDSIYSATPLRVALSGKVDRVKQFEDGSRR